MTQSPLLLLLALGTAHSSILSYHWEFRLWPILALAWAFALVVHICVWRSWYYPYHVSELRHIPTVPGYPLWGQIFEITTQECGVPQRQWHEKYGPMVRYFFPFGSERLSVTDATALSRITGERSRQYPKPWRVRQWMGRIFGNGLLLAEGDEHIHLRRMLHPAFSNDSVKMCLPVFWEKGLLLAAHWHDQVKCTKSGTATIEVLDWLSRASLDAIGKVGFGYDVNALDQVQSPIHAAYRIIFASDLWPQFLQLLHSLVPRIQFIPFEPNREVSQACDIIMGSASNIVHQMDLDTEMEDCTIAREKKAGTNYCNIIYLMRKHDRMMNTIGGKGLSLLEKRDQIMTFLGTGHDATAVALAWTFHLLAKYPHVQVRLRDEIKFHYPLLFDHMVSPSVDVLATADPDKLPYLNNVCHEVLRFIPPVPMISRKSEEDDVLAGYHIPAGTTIHIVANAINHLSMYWGPTAGQFDPGRWERLPESWRPNAFATFSYGPRACVGNRFSQTEMKVLLCALLSRYIFEQDAAAMDPEKSKVWRWTLRPKYGITLRVSAVQQGMGAACNPTAHLDCARVMRRSTS